MKTVWHLLKRLMVIGLILTMAGLYWHGAMEQLIRVNTDMQSGDQSAYMNYAREMYESHYASMGKRNRMPVYPFLQSLFYHPDLTDQAFFVRGKQLNIVLSVGLLACLAFIFRKYLSRLQSLNLLLITAFTIFILGLRGIEWVNLIGEGRKTCELRRVFALRSGSVLACRMNGGNSEAKAATLGCILLSEFSAGTDGARHFW
jgi:hypothetical protein